MDVDRRTDHEPFRRIISVRDIIYFLLLPAVFLGFTVTGMDNKREGARGWKKYVPYAGICLVFVAGAFLSSLPLTNYYYDATRTKLNTVTRTTQDILKRIEGPVTVTAYTNMLGYNDLAMPRNYSSLERQFDVYRRFKKDIGIEYVYYYDLPPEGMTSVLRRFPDLDNLPAAARRACALEKFPRRRMLSPEQIKSKIDLSSENNDFIFMLSRDNGQRSVLRILERRLPSELMVASAFNRFLEPEIKVGFVEGGRSVVRDGLTDYFHFSADRTNPRSLVNTGFLCEQISLSESAGRIPRSVEILVIADPETHMPGYQIDKVLDFIDNGGNLLIAGEPDGQDILNPILRHIGYEFGRGRLVQEYPGDVLPQNLILARFAPEITLDKSTMPSLPGQGDDICVTMPDAVPIYKIADTGFTPHTILYSDTTAMTWTELQTRRFDDGQKAHYDPQAGETEGVFELGIALRREINGKTQNIVILGDADCLSTAELSRRADRGIETANGHLITELFRQLTSGRRPLDMSRPYGTDDGIKLSMAAVSRIGIFLKWIIPSLMAGACVIMVFRRKSK